jgi:hypothetical protein
LLEVTIQLLADGLNAPIFPAAPDDSSGRRFIGEQRGDVYIIDAAGKRLEAIPGPSTKHGDAAQSVR